MRSPERTSGQETTRAIRAVQVSAGDKDRSGFHRAGGTLTQGRSRVSDLGARTLHGEYADGSGWIKCRPANCGDYYQAVSFAAEWSVVIAIIDVGCGTGMIEETRSAVLFVWCAGRSAFDDGDGLGGARHSAVI
jgi:hypothetical protein